MAQQRGHNWRDMMRRGEQCTHAKLTWAQVRAIRADAARGVRQRDLAEQHGVHRRTIYDVLHNHTWRG